MGDYMLCGEVQDFCRHPEKIRKCFHKEASSMLKPERSAGVGPVKRVHALMCVPVCAHKWGWEYRCGTTILCVLPLAVGAGKSSKKYT